MRSSSMPRGLGALTLLLTVLLAAPAVRADPAKATANFEKGTRLYQVGEYAKALEEFKAGYIEEADPSFLFNTAQCYWRLGKEKDALLAYRRFLSLAPETPLQADVERKIAELEQSLERAARDAPPLAAPTLAARKPVVESASLTEGPPEVRSQRRWPIWVGGVLTLGFAGAATAVGLAANARYEQLRTTCGRAPNGCNSASISDVSNRSRLVNVLGALAGVSAVATGVAFFATSKEAGVSVAMRF